MKRRNWANLEALPLGLILYKLEEHIDHVWFGAVCKSWRSIAKFNHQNHQFKVNTLPMLMISIKTNDSSIEEKKNGLYGILNKRWYPLQFQVCRANNPKLSLRGSSHGWFAFVDNYSKSIVTLMSPFTDIPCIILPPLNCVSKVTLSADPIKSPNDYMVVAIYDCGNLAYVGRGQQNWTYIDTSKSYFIDVMFYKGLLFAINIRTKIVSFNIGYSDDTSDKTTITSNVVLEEKVEHCFLRDKFLVKSLEEELWMVRRCDTNMSTFNVYKLNLDAKSEKLEHMCELKSLGDNILFLGAGDSISVSASYFSKSLQRDSIYFADGLKIYNMKNGAASYRCPYWDSPYWILPHFQ